MSEETSTPSGGGEAVSVVTVDAGTPAELTLNQAARARGDFNEKRNKSAESAEPATADKELAQANPESPEGTTEGDKETEPAKPAIDPPKSWTKDLHDHWNTLDPVLQERIVARDREDQAAIKRAFNEAADERKAVKAEREAAEKARQQYEAQLPALMQSLQDAQQNSFSDIRTVQDVEKLQAEDPFRFQAWQVQQMKLQAAHAENERVSREKARAQESEWNSHVQKENELAAENIPELADKTKVSEFYKRAVDRLKELGFKPEEVDDLANGKTKLSIHDHRLQMLLASDFRRADIEKAKAAVAEKPLPPVQRPGARQVTNTVSDREKTLDQTLTTTGSLRAAQQLLAAKRAAQQRRSP